MAIPPKPNLKKQLPPPWLPPDAKVLRQALDLFLFSATFAILFNLFYADGIELKTRPKIEGKNSDPLASATPKAYPGIARTPLAFPTPDPLAGYNRVSLQGAKERFDAKRAVFLDARPADEYKEAHIPGALNFYADDFDKLAPLVLPQLSDKTQELVAYCHGASCELSIHLAKRLSELGYKNVKVFFGGWPEWKKAGYPVTGEGTP